MPNESDSLLDFTGIRYYDGYIQAWASGAFATKEELDEIRAQAAKAYHFCGSVPTVADLPVSAHEGDVYNIGGSLDGDNYVWAVWPDNPSAVPPVSAGSGWDKLGATVDLSQYLTWDDIATLVTPGVMSPEDKAKLDSIEPQAKNITVDAALSAASTNPVRNSVLTAALNTKLDKTQLATSASNGAMAAADKAKLDGIASSANLFVLEPATPTVLGGVVVDVAVDTTVSSSGGIPDSEVAYHVVQNKAVHSEIMAKSAALSGQISAQSAALFGALASKLDKTQLAGASQNGVMTAADWNKLSGIAEGANVVIVDAALNASSINPVQNKVIKAELDAKVPAAGFDPQGYVAIGGTAVQAITGQKKFTQPISGTLDGNAATATKLQSARQIVLQFSGGSSVSASFDGTASAVLNVDTLPEYSWTDGVGGVAGLVPAPDGSASADYVLQANGSFAAPEAALGSTLVHLSGDGVNPAASEVISGVKTFSASPIVPQPSGFNYLGRAGEAVGPVYIVANGSALPSFSSGSGVGAKGFSGTAAAGVYVAQEYTGAAWVDSAWASAGSAYLAGDDSAGYRVMQCFNNSGASAWLYDAGGSAGQILNIGAFVNSAETPAMSGIGSIYAYAGSGGWAIKAGTNGDGAIVPTTISTVVPGTTNTTAVVSNKFWYNSAGAWTLDQPEIAMQAANVATVNEAAAFVDQSKAGEGAYVDGNRNAHAYVVVPRYNTEDLGFSIGTGTPHGFSSGVAELSAFSAGKYAISVNGVAAQCAANSVPVVAGVNELWSKGVPGVYGPMPNAMWAARALWTYKQAGSSYQGNYASGKDPSSPWQHGVLAPGAENAAVTAGATLTGTGPLEWMDDGTPNGLADMAGNVWEFVAGARVVDGEIQVVDGLADLAPGGALDALPWSAIAPDGSFVAPGSPSTLHYGGNGASITIGTAAPSGALLGQFQAISIGAGVSTSAANLLKQLCLAPVDVDAGQSGGFSMPATGTAYLCRGGSYKTGNVDSASAESAGSAAGAVASAAVIASGGTTEAAGSAYSAAFALTSSAVFGSAGAGLFAMRFVADGDDVSDVGTRLAYK